MKSSLKKKITKQLNKYGWDFKKIIIALFSLGIFFAGFMLVWFASLPIPDLNSFEQRRVLQSTKIFDRTGEILLYDANQNVRRTIIPIEEISRFAKNATVAIEDAEFYEHNGVRPMATFRAVFIQPLRGKGIQGGSTITQQVVKNSILTQEKLISRKLKEWILAIKLEKVVSKERILEIYLNEAPYGGSIYGIEEASQAFFHKPSADLTLAEAAYLAALPQAPTYYSPYGNHTDDLERRKNLVLAEMLENKFINETEYQEALGEEVEFKERPEQNIRAPHFVFFVLDYLREKYGERAIEESGFRVTTTLDYELQEKAEEIVKRKALENSEKFNAENASIVSIDSENGQILVMVGSRDYFDQDIDGAFNIALAHRQPGSSFKPFVYAESFNQGYTPKTVVFDLKTEFSARCSPSGNPLYSGAVCYSPGNYDNVFRGPIRLEEALAQSVNVPAVKLLYLTGIDRALSLAESMGIESLGDKKQYGLTLVLGGGEVSLLDMTSAYGVFANEGVRVPYQRIIKIEDVNGEIVEEPTPDERRVLPKQTALQISQILSSDPLRAPAFGVNSYLNFPGYDVAAKTGTTNDYKDAWIVGYTPRIAVGAWAGNNDNTPMEKKVAGFIIAPLWNEFMQEILKKYPNESFPEPDPEIDPNLKPILRGVWQGGNSVIIDTRTGLPANELTPPEFRREVVNTEVHSILHWVDKNNPRGPIPSNPSSDSQYRLWEVPVQNWASRQNLNYFPNYTNPNQGGNTTNPPITPTQPTPTTTEVVPNELN